MENKNSTVTALIPTKNRSKLLLRAIQSILNQTHPNVVVQVRDNCSTDETETEVAKLGDIDKRIIYKKNIKDIGPHENFRQGLKEIQTDYFSILGDDDFLDRSFYAEGIELLQNNPDTSFIVFTVNMVNAEGKFLFNNSKNFKIDKSVKKYTSAEGVGEYLANKIPATWTGYLFKREVAELIDLGEFSEVGYGADIYFIWHAACRFNFIVTNSVGGYYTIHENTTSNTLVKPFDERFIYWWRNRIRLILNDKYIDPAARIKIEKFYIKKASTRYPDKWFYLRAALVLISMRVATRDKSELRFDFIIMRTFLPEYIYLLIKYVYYPLEIVGFILFIKNILLVFKNKTSLF